MTTLFLRAVGDHVEITAELDASNGTDAGTFRQWVCPGESFGGYRYEELREIATNPGQMDACDLKV